MILKEYFSYYVLYCVKNPKGGHSMSFVQYAILQNAQCSLFLSHASA
jgi:hypothetical protein